MPWLSVKFSGPLEIHLSAILENPSCAGSKLTSVEGERVVVEADGDERVWATEGNGSSHASGPICKSSGNKYTSARLHCYCRLALHHGTKWTDIAARFTIRGKPSP